MPPTRPLSSERTELSLVERLKHLRPVRDDDYTSGKTQADATTEDVTAEQIEHVLRQPEQPDPAGEQPTLTSPPSVSSFMKAAEANEKLLRGMLDAVFQPLDELRQEQEDFRLDMQKKVDQHVGAGFDLAARLEKMAANLPGMRQYVGDMRSFMGKALVPDATTDDQTVF